ncbi:MAG: glycosyltransferase family 1 protein [Candidatus Auribacterota bacterium]|nr:glycosyltransferase family 1 protein [Candidatus Auribacterota bacterium]
MRIVINALSAKTGGGVTYFNNLLPALGRRDRDNEYLVLLSPSSPVRLETLPDNFKTIRLGRLTDSPLLRVVYEQFLLPFFLAREKADLFYSPTDMTTLASPCPVVLAMRNPVLYTKIPLQWRGKDRLRSFVLSKLARLSARKAERIIFVSESSRREIAGRLKIDPAKTRAIHHGFGSGFRPKAGSAKESEELKLPPEYILSVSTIYWYKNYLSLIKAYHNLISSHSEIRIPLVIVGGNADDAHYRKLTDYISRNELSGRVILFGGIDYSRIAEVYSRAKIFIFPSYLETFGHPSLEAMASGVPVVAARTGVMEEILGAAAIYFDPFDQEEMEEKIKLLMDNSELRRHLVEKGKKRVKDFSWEKTARETLEVFQEIN